MSRALRLDGSGWGTQEIADAETLNVGNIAPLAGNLTIGGFTGSNVLISAGQTLGVSGATGGVQFTGGADLLAAAGSTLSGFDSIEGILSGNLVDKSATELITGQWTFQASNLINPKLIVQAAGGEAANSLLFQVQNSLGANLFSVDVEGDVVVAGGETVAGTTIFTGDITLGDGGNTIKIGADTTPAVGDNVYINTTGTANGNFAVTTANFNIATNGDFNSAGDLTLTGGGTITTSTNGNLILATNGIGVINATSNFNATAGLDVSGAALTSSAGLTLTLVGITMTGLDIGTALARAGTVYCTSLDATDLNTDGTNSNIWVVNENAAAGTAENAALITEGGDGANLQVFHVRQSSGTKTLSIRYKQNPTDPKDLTEAGYTDIATFFSTQEVELYGTLSFGPAATAVIDTSGNRPLSITVGTSTLTTTAGLVDLRTSTTALDVPSGTGFMIGGAALTTANFTAPNVDILLNGSNADSLHTHTAVDADQIRVTGLNTAAMGVTPYVAGYVSANNTISLTDCSVATGSFAKATFAGVWDGVANEMVMNGKVTALFDALLAPAPAAGDPAILSWTTSGQFKNTSSGSPGGSFVTRVGTVLDASSYAINQRCVILIQAQSPTKK